MESGNAVDAECYLLSTATLDVILSRPDNTIAQVPDEQCALPATAADEEVGERLTEYMGGMNSVAMYTRTRDNTNNNLPAAEPEAAPASTTPVATEPVATVVADTAAPVAEPLETGLITEGEDDEASSDAGDGVEFVYLGAGCC
jgi:hypothetical protein